MSIAQADSAREVVIKLVAAVDQAASAQAFAQMVRQAEAMQQRIDQIRANGAQAQAKLILETVNQQRQAQQQAEATAQKVAQQTAATQVQAQQQALQAATKTAKAEAAAIETTAAAADKAAAQQIAAQESIATAHEEAVAVIRAANEQLLGGVHRVLGGVLLLTRALAFLGVAGEQDVKKLLRQVIQIHAVIDVARGLIALVQGATRAWRGYTTAVEAAAAAHTALETAKAAGAAGKAAGAIGGAVGAAGAAGQVAGAAGGAASVAAAVAPIVTALAPIALLAVSLVGVVKYLFWLYDESEETEKKFQAKLKEQQRLSEVWTAKYQADEVKRERRVATGLELAELETLGEENLGTRKDKLRVAGAAVYPELAKVQAQRQELDTGLISEMATKGGAALEHAAGLAQAEADLLRNVEQLKREGLDIAIEERKVRISTAEEVSQKLLDQKKQYEEIIKTIRTELASAEERFGQLSPLEQVRAIQIKQRADRGQKLTAEERQVMRGVGLESTTAIARKGDVEAARRAGFEKYFGQEERGRLAEMQKRVQRTELDIKTESEIKLRLEMDIEQMSNMMKPALAKIKADILQAVEDAAGFKHRQQQTEQWLRENRHSTQERAITGG